MDQLDSCFVEALQEPVRIVDVPPKASAVQSHHLSNLLDLKAFLNKAAHQDYSCRFISICQRNSWRPLQITRPMFDLIVSNHGLESSIYDLASSFYTRYLKLEETFCVPLSHSRKGPWIDISYTIRYPELKPPPEKHELEEGEVAVGEWAIRQSGIHHRFNIDTRQHIFVLISPLPNSKLQIAAEHLLLVPKPEVPRLFWLHKFLFETHLPAWRQYILSQEKEFLPISNTAFSTYIDEQLRIGLRIGYDNLNILVSLEGRFAQIAALLASTTDTLGDLSAIFINVDDRDDYDASIKLLLGNYRRQCASYANTGAYLRFRVQTTSHFLANTLSYRDQVIANEQNNNMMQLNKSAVFITIVTLAYVPASFVASFFGSNFFALDVQRSRIVSTSMIWIFIVSSLVLTLISGVFYYWLVRHDGLLFWRLVPKMHKGDWKNPKKSDAGLELSIVNV